MTNAGGSSKKTMRLQARLRPKEVRERSPVAAFAASFVVRALLLCSVAVFVIGVILTYAAGDVRIFGSTSMRWGVFWSVAFLVAPVAWAVARLFVLFLRRKVRLLWHILGPMERGLSGGVWVGIMYGLARPVLGDDVESSALNQMQRILLALGVVASIFCIHALVVTLLEARVFRVLFQQVREGRCIDRFMLLVSSKLNPDAEHREVLSTIGTISVTDLIAHFSTVAAARDTVALGLRCMSPLFPLPDEGIVTVTEPVIRAAGELRDRLFALCGKTAEETLAREDLARVMGSSRAAAETLFFSERKVDFICDCFDLYNDGQVSYATAKDVIVDFCSQRSSLVVDISGHALLVQVAGQLLGVVGVAVSIFVLLASIGVDLLAAVLPLSAVFFALSFAFSGPIADFVRGLHHVLVRRPYEIGDRISFDGESMFVRQISIMTTVAAHVDGYEVSILNSVIANKTISNLRRSRSAFQRTTFVLSSAFTAADLADLKAFLVDFAEAEPRVYDPKTVSIFVDEVKNDRTLKLTLAFNLRIRSDMKLKWLEAKSRMIHAATNWFNRRGVMWGADLSVHTKDATVAHTLRRRKSKRRG